MYAACISEPDRALIDACAIPTSDSSPNVTLMELCRTSHMSLKATKKVLAHLSSRSLDTFGQIGKTIKTCGVPCTPWHLEAATRTLHDDDIKMRFL
jgi:hypothetical protein